jgi:C1A family cysteine protease
MPYAKGKLPGKDPVAFRHAIFDPHGALPPSQSYEYDPRMPAVFDQGDVGSCVLNGTLALAEFVAHKRQGHAFAMSRRAAYYKALVDQGYPLGDNGLNVSDGLFVLKNNGYVNESDWPYEMQLGSDFFAPVPDALWRMDFHLGDYVSVTDDVDSMKRALFTHGPIVIGSAWAAAWENDVAADGMLLANPDPATDQGGHCTVLVGWSDLRRAFRLRNSWNTSWGDVGHAWLPYAVRDQAPHFWPTDLYTVEA